MSGSLSTKKFNPVLFLVLGIVLASAWPVYSYMIKGSEVRLDTAGFNQNLSGTVSTVQGLADAVDNLPLGGDTYDKIEFVIDGHGRVITSGASGHKVVPFSGTITKWEVVSSVSGSIIVDVKKSTYSGFNTFSSIAGTEKPTITAGTKATDTTLSTWTTSVASGDRIQAVVNSSDIVGAAVLTLYVTKG